MFVAIPGSLPWTTFRDVYEVDGQMLRDREARLERLFAAPTQASLEAAAIVQESARHNVGTAYRDVNLPTLTLQVLRPSNQSRFSFERRGTRTIAGFQGVEVAFEEPARAHSGAGPGTPGRAHARPLLDRLHSRHGAAHRDRVRPRAP